MATRQYIGARYVPIFADPVQWSDDRTYEPLMMVQSSGETYITKQATPIGAQLPDIAHGEEDNEFWVHMSNWNAQIEQYREEVLQYNGRISSVEDALPVADFDSESTVKDAIDGLSNILPAADFSSENTVKDAIDGLSDILPAADFSSENTVKDYIDSGLASIKIYNPTYYDNVLCIGDSWGTGYGASSVGWGTELQTLANFPTFKQMNEGGYKIGGAEPNYSTLATNAYSTEDERNAVQLIVFLGGANDGAPETIVSQVESFANTCHTLYPNAHIIGGYNCPFVATSKVANAVQLFNKACLDNDIMPICDLPKFVLSLPISFWLNTDYWHLTNYKPLAEAVYSFIKNGNFVTPYQVYSTNEWFDPSFTDGTASNPSFIVGGDPSATVTTTFSEKYVDAKSRIGCGYTIKVTTTQNITFTNSTSGYEYKPICYLKDPHFRVLASLGFGSDGTNMKENGYQIGYLSVTKNGSNEYIPITICPDTTTYGFVLMAAVSPGTYTLASGNHVINIQCVSDILTSDFVFDRPTPPSGQAYESKASYMYKNRKYNW